MARASKKGSIPKYLCPAGKFNLKDAPIPQRFGITSVYKQSLAIKTPNSCPPTPLK